VQDCPTAYLFEVTFNLLIQQKQLNNLGCYTHTEDCFVDLETRAHWLQDI